MRQEFKLCWLQLGSPGSEKKMLAKQDLRVSGQLREGLI